MGRRLYWRYTCVNRPRGRKISELQFSVMLRSGLIRLLLITLIFIMAGLLFAHPALLVSSVTRRIQEGALPANVALRAAAKAFHTEDIYAADRPNQLSPVVKDFPSRVYVPNSDSASVDVIDPTTYQVVDHFKVGRLPQHIVPSYDLKTLWVLDDQGYALTKIDPATAKVEKTVSVDDPYNLYFTPDGSEAIVVAEALHRLDFRDPQTMKMMEEMGKYNDELKKAGILKMAEGLEPSSKGSVLGSMDRTVTSSMGRSSQRVIWLRDSGCGK